MIDSKTGGRTHYRAMVEGEWLGQWDLIGRDGQLVRPTVIIESVDLYKPPQRRKVRKPDGSTGLERLNKLAIRFRGKRKGWICGPASQRVIAEIYGPVIQDWIGKPIQLYVDPNVTFGRMKVGGIRVVNTSPTDAPTDEPLDNAVDEETSAKLNEAFLETGGSEREPGEEG